MNKKNYKKDLEDNEIIENENENDYNDIQTCNTTIIDYITRFFSICMYHYHNLTNNICTMFFKRKFSKFKLIKSYLKFFLSDYVKLIILQED